MSCFLQAHCRRLATGHLPAASQGVALDADPVVESASKDQAPKRPALSWPAPPGSSAPMHHSAPAPPPRAPSAPVNRLMVRGRSINGTFADA